MNNSPKEAAINSKVAEKFHSYPIRVSRALRYFRKLIFDTASEMNDIGEIEESLKWGDPSYSTRIGSTIRIGLKQSNPEQYAIFFHCRTSLISTFKELHGDILRFDGNRAILFYRNDILPEQELKQCISLALRYHRIKHLPMLGA